MGHVPPIILLGGVQCTPSNWPTSDLFSVDIRYSSRQPTCQVNEGKEDDGAVG